MRTDRCGASRRLQAAILWELFRYDLLFAFGGLERVRKSYASLRRHGPEVRAGVEATIHDAYKSVVPFYWKPVRCLQRSFVIARVLRRYGVGAEIVIGYRPAPFFGHAWVEVGGRVVSD